MSDINSGTTRGLISYLSMIIEKGRATEGAIKPLSTAVKKITQAVDGDDWEQTDVRSIDSNDYVQRFANITAGQYTNRSISTYQSRMVRAIEWYKKFLDDPGWMPAVDRRQRSKSNKINRDDNTNSNEPKSNAQKAVDALSAKSVNGTIGATIPLNNGKQAKLILPEDFITRKDAERIKRMIDVYTLEQEEK